MTLLRFFRRYFGRYALWLGLALLAAGVYATATGAVVALLEPVFREVLQAQSGDVEGAGALVGQHLAGEGEEGLSAWLNGGYRRLKGAFGVGPAEVVFFVPILMVVVFLVRGVAGFFSGYSFQHIGLGVTTDIRNDLYRAVLGQSSRFHAAHPSGELISRIVNDVAMMQTAVSTRVVDLVQQGLTLVVLLFMLFSRDWRLALVCVVAMPVFIYPIVRFGQGMRRTSHKSQERMAELAALVGDGVRGHRVVKAFNMERFENQRFRRATRRHLRVNLWATVLDNLSGPVVETLGVFFMAALLTYAGLQIRAGEMSAPVFIAFLGNLVWIYEPLRKLNRANMVIQQSLAAARRVRDLIALPTEIVESASARSLAGVRREIHFDHVSFAYEDEVVLHDVDLRLEKGRMVALVGPSGAGKSTLVNLLPRFFDPDSGAVRIDGVDIRDVTLASLRALIGLVTQETVLFNDTVRNNIAYGRSDLPLERIREAAAAAYADQFIIDLPGGYDAMIGEGGLKLSGGQRQRLTIARALVKDPPILILDEATSQLDTESEALVRKALANLMQGRTTLVIAHRLSTVTEADRIVVLDGGRVVEQGVHHELLAAGGLYKRLHDMQFQD